MTTNEIITSIIVFSIAGILFLLSIRSFLVILMCDKCVKIGRG